MFLYDCQINQIMKINYFGRIFKGGTLCFLIKIYRFSYTCAKNQIIKIHYFSIIFKGCPLIFGKKFLFFHIISIKIAIFCQKTKGPPFENQIKTSHFYDFYMKKNRNFLLKSKWSLRNLTLEMISKMTISRKNKGSPLWKLWKKAVFFQSQNPEKRMCVGGGHLE